MGYSNEMIINGFEVEFGRMNMSDDLGIFLNFENDSIKKAMLESNPLLIDTIKKALLMS